MHAQLLSEVRRSLALHEGSHVPLSLVEELFVASLRVSVLVLAATPGSHLNGLAVVVFVELEELVDARV